MSISYEDSLPYFKNHVQSSIWTKAGEIPCRQAIAHARRILSSTMGRALDDDEADYVEGDSNRDEYAVYEQALYMIANGFIADGDGVAPIGQLTGDLVDPDVPRKASRATLAPEALRWLGIRGNSVVLIKG